MSDKKSDKKRNDEILRVARERFDLAVEAESDIRRLALEDLKFRAGEQWPEEVKQDRELNKRPCLTINRVPQFVRQITNDQRKNRPAIKVSPTDDKADIETAKILQGLVRHIEYNSNADVAYDTAFEGAVTKGFGYWRVITAYVDAMSFNQEILIKKIRNDFSVYLDPSAKEPDGSDANWGFIVEDVKKDDYKAEYGESDLAQSQDWSSIGDTVPGWASKDSCRIAEYFYKEFKDVTLVLLSNGEVLDKSEMADPLPKGIQIRGERKTKVPVIKWSKINGLEILEETDWLGQWIPIIPVYGDELDVDGDIIREGIVRHSKDSQRMYNYWASTETETIALAPKAPFIVAEGQIPKEYEHIWRTANTKNHAYLPYKPTSLNQQPVPPPTRNVFEAPVQAITQARMQASEDIKATTGIYDASLGDRSNETSGIAIQRRTQQSENSNFHFFDNLTRSIKHCGRIVVDLIPKIYDAPRTVRILGEDGTQEIVTLNQIFQKNGKPTIYDVSLGKYDVAIETGPSYATKRQDALASMIDLTKAYPKIGEIASDLLVRNMDWPGATEIADRLKKTLPPGISEDEKDNQQPIPPQVKAQMAQMGQMIQGLTEHLNAATETIKTKKMELDSKERIELAKLEVGMRTDLLKLSQKDAMMGFQRELAQLDQRQQQLEEPDGNTYQQPGANQPQPGATYQQNNGPGSAGAAASNVQPMGPGSNGAAGPTGV